MNSIIDLFSNYTFQVVALGCAILGIVSGVLGSFAVLRKQSLLGDCVSHSALPGIVIAFLLIGVKDLEILLVGALVSGVLSTFVVIFITKYSKIKIDSALAITISLFFGFGLVLLTYTQRLSNAAQAGLSSFIYGQAATMLKEDVIFLGIVGVIIIAIVLLLYKEFKAISFDKQFMKVLGFNTGFISTLLTLLIVISIVIGLKLVGVILMSAMLVAPALAARQWTNKLSFMIILSSIFGALSGVLGVMCSSLISSMPTGPIIVVFSSIIVFISILFAPKRGVIFKIYQRYLQKKNLITRGVI